MIAGLTPEWRTLQGVIDGEVALPGSPSYERAHRPFNARFHEVRPKAIVLCATPQDVSETIAFLVPEVTNFHLAWPYPRAAGVIEAWQRWAPNGPDELFQLKHAVTVDPEGATGDKAEARRWVTRSWASVHPWESGRVFQNFVDPDLEGWTDAYYGTNYEHLVRVKAKYDLTGFFRFHQSLPVR